MKYENRCIKHRDFLHLLGKSKKKLRGAIILNCDKDQLFSICECILNICNGNIKLDENNFNKLKKYNKIYKKVLDKSIDFKTKKKYLVQKGGFLQILIPAVISGIASIISAAISRNETRKENDANTV